MTISTRSSDGCRGERTSPSDAFSLSLCRKERRQPYVPEVNDHSRHAAALCGAQHQRHHRRRPQQGDENLLRQGADPPCRAGAGPRSVCPEAAHPQKRRQDHRVPQVYAPGKAADGADRGRHPRRPEAHRDHHRGHGQAVRRIHHPQRPAAAHRHRQQPHGGHHPAVLAGGPHLRHHHPGGHGGRNQRPVRRGPGGQPRCAIPTRRTT